MVWSLVSRHLNWPLYRFGTDDKYDLPQNVRRWTLYNELCHLTEMNICGFHCEILRFELFAEILHRTFNEELCDVAVYRISYTVISVIVRRQWAMVSNWECGINHISNCCRNIEISKFLSKLCITEIPFLSNFTIYPIRCASWFVFVRAHR